MKMLSAAALVTLIAVASAGPIHNPWPIWVERIGWTLVHSVWQLAAVALVAALVDYSARRSSANARYIVAALALGIMLVLPGVTWMCVAVDRPVRPARPVATNQFLAPPLSPEFERDVSTAVDPESPDESSALAAVDGTALTPFASKEIPGNEFPGRAIPDGDSRYADPNKAAPSGDAPPLFRPLEDNEPERTLTPLPEFVPDSGAEPEFASSPGSPRLAEWLRAVVEPRLPWLVSFWLSGVGLCSLRPLRGLWGEWRLRRTGLSAVPESVSQTLVQLAQRMRISRPVRIAHSALVRVPVVVGYLRPVILLPVGVIIGLTPTQLEAVLAHELAHVRRHDWLINALQVLAETVLFYHPAVWWISRRVRHTRELCCDDLALGQLSDKAVFARALLVLEELRQKAGAPYTATSLAATGGQLSARIRRLLPLDPAPEQAPRGWLTGTILLLALSLAGGVSLLAKPPADSGRTERAAVAADAEKEGADSDPDAIEDVEPGNTATFTNGGGFDKLEGKLRVVTVVDEKGRPIAGATVRFQFRIEAEHSGFALNPVKTDAQGVAQSEIPRQADHVGIYVTAEGFSEGSAEELATGKSTIKLTRGRVVRVRAIDSEKRMLKDALPLLAGTHTWGREFNVKKEGVHESPAMAMSRKILRVACSQKEGPILFSDSIDVSTAKPGADGVYEVTLRPGVRLEGRLDDSVPRPVTEGYAELMIVERENGSLATGERWEWKDFTPVRPDGTFTFESLPGGGHAQLLVLVDGYISKNPSPAELKAYMERHKLLNEGQLAKLAEQIDYPAMRTQFVALDQPRVEFTVPCAPTAACDFRLLDPSGKPVEGATVTFNPNGAFLYGNMFIPGTEESQALLVDGVRTGHETDWFLTRSDPSPHGQEAKRRTEWAERSFLGAISDAEGRVRIRNLPGSAHESYHIHAKGLVLPVSPLLDDKDLAKRNIADDRDRYGAVELVSGETIEKAIYLEREQPTVDRELIVVNRTGKPLADVSLAVSEIRVGPRDWQTWSTQRFGPLPKGVTDKLGRLTLRLPGAIDKVAVERIRVGINYDYDPDQDPRSDRETDPDERLFISRRTVDVPLAADDGVIVLLPHPDKPSTYAGIVRYGRLEEILPGKTQAEWLAMLVKEPNLAILRKLLAGAKGEHPEPVELLDSDRHGPRIVGQKSSGGIRMVSDGNDEFAVVETHARPLSGALAGESDFSRLPECVFVFDKEGTLLAAIGGELGRTDSNNPDSSYLVNLGPREDWFVRVSRFEKNGPFDYVSTYYRLANPVVQSLHLVHPVRSGSWSIGPEKVKRYGTLTYNSPDVQDGTVRRREVGITADGVAIIPGLVWDGDRNRFVGPAAPLLRGRPLYEIDTDWSKDFEVLSPKANQLVISGGEYDYGNIWDLVVPEGFQALVTLSIPQKEGPARVIERKLLPGRQNIQLYIKPVKKGDVAKIELRVTDSSRKDEREKLTFDLPHRVGDRPPLPPPIFHTLSPQETAHLLNRTLTTSTESLTLDIQLVPR